MVAPSGVMGGGELLVCRRNMLSIHLVFDVSVHIKTHDQKDQGEESS